jgi:hypothetical protein
MVRHFLVLMQSLENYGAHAESGRFADGKHYWKFKPGGEIIVSIDGREADAMAFVMAQLECEQSIAYKRWPVSALELDDPSEYTEYEQFQLEYDGNLLYPTERVQAHALQTF